MFMLICTVFGVGNAQGFIGENITLNDVQVYSESTDKNYHTYYTPLNRTANMVFSVFGWHDGDRAAWNYKSAQLIESVESAKVEIKAGKLILKLGRPKIFLSCNMGNGVTVYPSSTKVFIIESFSDLDAVNELYLRSSEDSVHFFYVDRDVTINGETSVIDDGGWTFKRKWNNVRLKKGWNYVILEYKPDSKNQITTYSFKSIQPNKNTWVYYQRETPPWVMFN